MDSGIATIISTSVSSFVTLIIFIGTSILSKTNYNKPAKLKIYEKQLVNVLEPLERIYGDDKFVLSEDILKETRRILYRHFALVPVQVFNAYKVLLSDMDNDDKLYVFRDTIASHYNWARKNLSFPSDANAITLRCLEPNNQVEIILNTIKVSALISTITLVIAVLYTVISVYWGPEIAESIKSMMYTIAFLYVTLAFIVSISVLNIRKRGSRYKEMVNINQTAHRKSKGKRISCHIFCGVIRRKSKDKGLNR